MTSYTSASGIYREHSTQWVDKKLDKIPYGQAGILKYDGKIWLKSYETLVASVDSEGWLVVNGLYSATTRKHIGAFMNEISGGLLNYHHAKQCYLDNVSMNIYTGEIKPA